MVRLLCLFGRHKRLGRLVVDDGLMLHSRCRHCGVAMVKKEGGEWVKDPAPEQPEPPEPSIR